ncbi:hypothetical protein [Alloalcanivorax xenomutans]|uniref:hypothetical protein n=1 Tax=Alloalcanivorax xenomutans TaxID=1094342 RepID=UPI003BA8A0AF
MTAERTDRELLMLAAKAYGVDLLWKLGFGQIDLPPAHPYILSGGLDKDWNPLEDDGDALRLAAHCMMDIEIGITYVTAGAPLAVPPVSVTEVFTDGARRLPMTRRAIVRAAAAMAEGGEHG